MNIEILEMCKEVVKAGVNQYLEVNCENIECEDCPFDNDGMACDKLNRRNIEIAKQYLNNGTIVEDMEEKKMENKFKNEIYQSIAVVHQDMAQMLSEIKYINRKDVPKQEGHGIIENILSDYYGKMNYLEYLMDLIDQ